MIYIRGFHHDIANDLKSYLLFSQTALESDITITDITTTDEGINIISSDAGDIKTNPKHACLLIGSQSVEIKNTEAERCHYIPIPAKLETIQKQISNWLETETTIALSEHCDFYPANKDIRCHKTDTTIHLTDKEAELLQFFYTHPNEVHDKISLLQNVWGYQATDSKTLETHIYRLRSKLADVLPENKGLITVEDGYRFAG